MREEQDELLGGQEVKQSSRVPQACLSSCPTAVAVVMLFFIRPVQTLLGPTCDI